MPYPYQNPYMGQPSFQMYPSYNAMQSQYPSPMGQQQQQQQEQPIHGFAYVQGIEGARAFHLPNGSEMPLFDNDRDILYVKTVDQSGRMSIDVKRVIDDVPEDHSAIDTSIYATQDDVRALHAEIDQLRAAISDLSPKPAHGLKG